MRIRARVWKDRGTNVWHSSVPRWYDDYDPNQKSVGLAIATSQWDSWHACLEHVLASRRECPWPLDVEGDWNCGKNGDHHYTYPVADPFMLKFTLSVSGWNYWTHPTDRDHTVSVQTETPK